MTDGSMTKARAKKWPKAAISATNRKLERSNIENMSAWKVE